MKQTIDVEPNEEPAAIDHLVGMISKTAITQERAAAYPMSNRVPVREYAHIKALAEYSGKSVNQVVVHLLRVALQQLSQALPPEDFNEVAAIRSRTIADLLERETGSSENYNEGN